MPALLNSAARVSLTSAPDDYKAPWQRPHSAADKLPGSQAAVAQSTAPCAELLSTPNADVALAHAQFPSLRYRCASNPQHLGSVSRVTNVCGLHSSLQGLQDSHERTRTAFLHPAGRCALATRMSCSACTRRCSRSTMRWCFSRRRSAATTTSSRGPHCRRAHCAGALLVRLSPLPFPTAAITRGFCRESHHEWAAAKHQRLTAMPLLRAGTQRGESAG
jgi:hypothetical protein